MIYDVVITEQAEDDLRRIYEYIAFELLSPDNALSQLNRLEENIVKLDNFPEKFRIYDKETWRSRGLRVMPVDNYLILYISNEYAGTVTVIRVMFSGRDVENQLNNHTKM